MLLLLEIGSNDFDQFFCGLVGVMGCSGTDQMYADVIFDHFPHQAVDRTSGSGDELQNIGAADFVLQLDRLDLPTNAPYAVEELGFLSDGLKHKKTPFN